MQIQLILPRPHDGQISLLKQRKRFNVVSCGRRWGKTTFGVSEIVAKTALDGKPAGWFAPNYKYLDEPWRELNRILKPVITKSNASDKVIELVTGGRIDFWTLEDPDAGRSRKYKAVVIDEAAMVDSLREIWRQAIRPTLADFQGEAWFLSSPKGVQNAFYEFFEMGKNPDQEEWASWIMPTRTNPHIKPEEIEAARKDLEAFPLIFQQEWLGEFISDLGEIIDTRWFKKIDHQPILGRKVRYFDIAISRKETADRSAGALMGIGPDRSLYLLDMALWRATWADGKERMIQIILEDAKRCKAEGCEYAVGFDARMTQMALFEDLAADPRLRGIALYPDRSKGDKLERASGWLPRARLGQFYIGPGWDHQSFFSECVAFTGSGKDVHDDQIDAVSGGSWLLSAHGYKPYEFQNENPFALRIE